MPNQRDAVKLIKEDHKQFKKLFRDFEAAKSGTKRQAIAEELFAALHAHSLMEEEIFYPAYREQVASNGDVDEAAEEHHVADVLMAEILQLDPDDDAYDAKFAVLIENVEHHLDEEEEDMLAKADGEFDADTKEHLANQMMQLREDVLADKESALEEVAAARADV